MQKPNVSLSVCLCLGALASVAPAVTMETVAVGNAGNGADTRYDPTGYGAVGYNYNIGKYEVTAGQYTEFLNAVAASDTYGLYNVKMDTAVNSTGCNIKRTGLPGDYSYSVASNWANRPVNYVSWGDAARFANWLHNGQPAGVQGLSTTEDGTYYLNGAITDAELLGVTRKASATWAIPTEDEWYKAAYHKNNGITADYWDYATGTNTKPVNHLTTPDGGNNANFYRDNNYTIGSPYWRTVVGEFENSDSPYGTFDQAGNVWEWNEAIIGSHRGERGGSCTYLDRHLPASNRNDLPPTAEYGDRGFRIAEVPEPASLTLLAVGLSLCTRRRS